MRNIKTTLRFARNSALMFAAASGMVYLTGCSESEITPGNEIDDNLLVEQLNVTTGTNPSLAKSYFNSHQGTRAAAFDVPEHPGMPKAPTAEQLAAMKVVDSETNFWWMPDNSTPTEFYVKGDVYRSGGTNNLRCDNMAAKPWEGYSPVTKYYIDGTLTLEGGFGGDENYPCEVYILNGGKLICNTNIPYATTIYLYEGGDIVKASSSDNIIYHKGTLIAEEDLVHGDTDITVEGNIYTYGKIHGKNVTLIGGEVYAGCSVTAEENIYLTGDNSNVCAGYVSAPVVELAGNSPLNILLRDGGYLNATSELRLKDVGNVFVMAEEGEYAMVETDVLDVNNKRLQGTFYNVAVKYNTQIGTQEKGAEETEVVLEWNESVQVNGEITDYTVVDGEGKCAPKVVQGPKDPTPDPDPVLENIGSVSPTDENHTHPISATCIFTNGQDAYLSWHTQGPNFHGCIEYLTVANGTVTLNSYLETKPSNDIYGAIDFNHVIFDNGKIFVAGDHPKKGGIVGWIECNDGKFVTGEAVLNIRQLYNEQGGSGNCIIRNGDYYQIASVKGFETFNYNDFGAGAKPKALAQYAAANFDPAGESATGRQTGKHIATDGSKVVMLTLINRDNEANTATASIKVFDATDVNYENVIASYVIADAVLSPVDGKDVVAIQGNDIWVCLGQGGVQHLKLAGNSISKASEFVLNNYSKEELKALGISTKEAASYCANGLAVDGKYVYVAHGGAGLVVLNKEDLSFVTRTRYNGGNSANYVNLNPDGYIYVAYGKSNVQVFVWKK